MTVDRIRGRKAQERRQSLFEREPLCRVCSANGRVRLATIADHVIALTNGGPDDETNLQPLCDECSEAKTNVDLGRQPRPVIGDDGWPT